MIRLLLALVITLCGVPSPVAADQPRAATHGVCANSPFPRGVCRAIRESQRPTWATNQDLAYIWRRESGFDRCAVNPGRHDCTYTGNASCGIAQLQPCRCFPRIETEVRCGVAYIVQRYKSPARAAQHEHAFGWY
jgi:hypothetical protein